MAVRTEIEQGIFASAALRPGIVPVDTESRAVLILVSARLAACAEASLALLARIGKNSVILLVE
jgi:hypothetical protein